VSLKHRQKRSKKRICNVCLEIGEVVDFVIRDGDRSIRSRIAIKNVKLTPIQDFDPCHLTEFSPFILLPPRELHIEIEAIPVIKGREVEIVAGANLR